jgi:hypothetical protein
MTTLLLTGPEVITLMVTEEEAWLLHDALRACSAFEPHPWDDSDDWPDRCADLDDRLLKPLGFVG